MIRKERGAIGEGCVGELVHAWVIREGKRAGLFMMTCNG